MGEEPIRIGTQFYDNNNNNNLLLLHDFSEISGNPEQKYILRIITHLIQHVVLEIQFRSIKCVTVTLGYEKISKRLQSLDEKKPLQKVFKRI